MKRSSHNYCGREEEKIYQEEYRDFLLEQKGVKHLDALLLDSSLISTTKNKTYYFKVIDCGDYKQIYYYNNLKIKKDKNLEKHIDNDYLFKKQNIDRKNEKQYIEYKNINRLFGKRRYFNSKNLIIPTEYYINCENDLEFEYILDIVNNYEEV